jgi:putative hydrolase of the HAD superfamily
MLDGIRWVLFDAVGTLIYADPPVAEAYRSVATRFGSQLTVAEISKRFRRALAAEQASGGPTSEAKELERWRRIVASVIDDVPKHAEALFHQLWRHFADSRGWRVYPDVHRALAALQLRGYRLGIASNFDGRLYRIVRRHSALAKIKAIFVSSDIGFTKPDSRFFRGVEERLEVDPGQIALVGDDEVSDVQGATAAGWRAIRLDRSGTCDRADTIHSLAELL